MERELYALRDQMSQKDDQIANMEQSSNQEIAGLTVDLEKLKLIALKPTSSRVLELTRDQAEDVDKMRSQVVSLAHALENSENRRAEVIDKIEIERQAHAESLRRMTINMKRFYSTLNMSDI
jgi:hypothetical protein